MTFGILGNTAKSITREVCSNLLAFLQEKNLKYVIDVELARHINTKSSKLSADKTSICSESELPHRCDILIALGGDGTMLSAARTLGQHGTPILGINLGKLGFLAEVSVDEIRECIDDIVKGNYVLEERMVLQANTPGKNIRYFALNEIVIDRGSSPRVIDLETYVNDDYLVTYAADGIILTTPTGSTAYSLASGGPIVTPQSNVITINPISPHTLTARPVIVPDTSVIRVVVTDEGRSVHITADGQVEGFNNTPAELSIQKAPYTVKLVKRKKRTYYDILRTKLMWGRDIRIKTDS
ncbi:MAG: NAD(+)/NADH kinase [Ignavibacteriae bacterium]|nr:NAD(+)/NADH kinase [Ignavibacteriota bacterium]